MSSAPRHLRRCHRCGMPGDRCLCEQLTPIDNRLPVLLLSHYREERLPTATSPLLAAALRHCRTLHHGLRRPIDLASEIGAQRALCLFPDDDAIPLDEVDIGELDLLVVPDGSWKQCRNMCKKLPGLAELQTLVVAATSHAGHERLSTFDAVARCMSRLDPDAGAALHTLGQAAFGRHESCPGPSSAPPLEILYQDDDLVAIRKPSGMAVHRGWAEDGPVALQRLRDQLGRWVQPVHRLDRGTSGVLLFALNEDAARSCERAFREGEVAKRYLALCRGTAELSVTDHPLARDGVLHEARTEFTRLATRGRYGLYECRPLTGRTHQIRRHLKQLSHPIIGDVRYGKGEHNRHFRDAHGLHRLALHCAEMVLPHPTSGSPLRLHAPLDGDLARVTRELFGPALDL